MGRLEVYLVDILEYMRIIFKAILKINSRSAGGVGTKQQRELDIIKSFKSMPINRFNEICSC